MREISIFFAQNEYRLNDTADMLLFQGIDALLS